jgi:hypothetical protein
MLLSSYDRTITAREEVLLCGLIDWVAVERVHWAVKQENAGEPLAFVQDKVLDLIRSLVTDGLFELGDLVTPNRRFGAWDTPLDEAIQQIRDVYVNQFDDDPEWWFYCGFARWPSVTPVYSPARPAVCCPA